MWLCREVGLLIWPDVDERLTWRHCNGLHFLAPVRPGRLRALFVTRLGGVSRPPYDGLNLARTNEDPGALDNRRLLVSALAITEDSIAWAPQVHGTSAVVARSGGRVAPSGDILLTDRPGVVLMGLFADCVPIILTDVDQTAVALVHAGWRGTAAGACTAGVVAMRSRLGIDPASLTAVIGPAIGPCCYRVGPEVLTAVLGGRWSEPGTLDLVQVNAAQLQAAGVSRERIVRAGICTSCRDDLFFSHRRSGGRTGRFAVLASLEPDS